jgi:hypothetical protein
MKREERDRERNKETEKWQRNSENSIAALTLTSMLSRDCTQLAIIT